MERRTCFTMYWLGDLQVLSCPVCGSCEYIFQLRYVEHEPYERMFYSVVCGSCEYYGEEVERELGMSEGTALILAVHGWNGDFD